MRPVHLLPILLCLYIFNDDDDDDYDDDLIECSIRNLAEYEYYGVQIGCQCMKDCVTVCSQDLKDSRPTEIGLLQTL